MSNPDDHEDHDDHVHGIVMPLGEMIERATQSHARTHARISDDWDRFYALLDGLDVDSLDVMRWLLNGGGPENGWPFMQYCDGLVAQQLRLVHKVNPTRAERVDVEALLAGESPSEPPQGHEDA